MITNQAIERAFIKANCTLNNKINQAQYQFYKPELDQNMKLMQIAAQRTMKQPAGDNPIAPDITGGNYGIR